MQEIVMHDFSLKSREEGWSWKKILRCQELISDTMTLCESTEKL